MSFIYENDKLIKELIKMAAPPAIPLPGQSQGLANAINQKEQSKMLEIAKQFVNNLQTQLSGRAVFTAEKDDANLNTTNLVSLDALINFIFFNGIKYNGIDIVKKADLSTTMPKAEGTDERNQQYAEELRKSGYYDYPPENAIYFIHKEGLEKYLRDLQHKGNRFLNVYVDNLIQEVNNKLKFNFSKREKPAPIPPADVKPGTKPAEPGAEPGAKPSGVQPGQAQIDFSKHINELFDELPLLPSDISIFQIRKFLRTAEILIGEAAKVPSFVGEAASSALTNIRQAENNINIVNQYSSTASVININTSGSSQADNYKKLLSYIKKYDTSQYYNFIDALWQLVMNVGNIIKHFKVVFGSYLKKTPQYLNLINQQVGDGNSYLNLNLEHLNNLKQSKPAPIPAKR